MSVSAEQGGLAFEGGSPSHEGKWPTWPRVTAADEAALMDVLRRGKWCGAADDVSVIHAFEEAFARLHAPSEHSAPSALDTGWETLGAVAVSSGTAALIVALDAAGVGPGDEVIVPPYTFIATASACLFLGAVPVFADVDPGTLCLDPAAVKRVVGPRTKVVLPVDVFGCPANLAAFAELCAERGLTLIEDACQAPGASWLGRPVGAWGQYACFSFQESKNLSAGEGGAVTARGRDLDTVWSLQNVGRVRGGGWYEHGRIGQNWRMTAFQAALLLSQLSRYPDELSVRQRRATWLAAALGECAGIRPLTTPPEVTSHAWHVFAFWYDASRFGGKSRAEFIAALKAEGIPASSGYYTLLSDNNAVGQSAAQNATRAGFTWRATARDDVPVAARASEQCVCLPQYVLLAEEEELRSIPAAINKIQRAWS